MQKKCNKFWNIIYPSMPAIIHVCHHHCNVVDKSWLVAIFFGGVCAGVCRTFKKLKSHHISSRDTFRNVSNVFAIA